MTDTTRARRLLITGAAGAVGRYLVELALAAGDEVIAVDLPEAGLEARPGVTLRLGDLRRRRFCREAVAGADVVIHAAASSDPGMPYEEMTALNFDAVRWLYEAAEDADAARFVFLSSANLYRPRRGVLAEDAEIEPRSPYTATKAEAERFLKGRPEGSLPWVILRPSLPYGPGSQAFGAALLTVPPLLRMFFPYVPGLTGGARNNWVHVEDIAAAALLVAAHDEASGQVFNVADDTPLAYGEILNAVIQAYGLHLGPMIPFPMALVGTLSPFVESDMVFRFLSRLLEPLWKRLEARHKLTGPLRPNVYRAGLAYLQGDRVVVTDALKALGWRPRWPDLREGMPETVRWYQQQRWVPDYLALPDDALPEEGIGLSYTEPLQIEAPRPGLLTLTVTFPDVRRLAIDQDAVIEGTITLDALVDEAPLVGTLKVHKVRRELTYEFTFSDEQGMGYRFLGRKRLTLLGMVGDFSQLDGTLINTRGEEIGALSWRMNLREDLGTLLRSIRLG